MIYFIFVALFFQICQANELGGCDKSIISRLAKMEKLSPTDLKYLSGKGFWRAGVSEYKSSSNLMRIQYGPLKNNACNASITMYDTKRSYVYEGDVIYAEALDGKHLGYHLSSNFVAYYAVKLSSNLLAIYRCEQAWQGFGPQFVLFASLDANEAAIAAEREKFKKLILTIDSKVKMIDNRYPGFL